MFVFKNIFIFLQIAIFSISLGDCEVFFSEKYTNELIEALYKTKTGWENNKIENIEGLANAMRVKMKDLTIVASKKVFDTNGKAEKTITIGIIIPGLKMKNSIDQENNTKSSDYRDYEINRDRFEKIKKAAEDLPGVSLIAHGKGPDESAPLEEGYLNEKFWYSDIRNFKLPKYNFTVVTDKNGMENILKQFENAPEPTIYTMDVDGNILYEKSRWTAFNSIVTFLNHSSEIPPIKIVEDAMAVYNKFKIVYPKSAKPMNVFKEISSYLQSKHSDFNFIVLDNTYNPETDMPCNCCFQLKYSMAQKIKICLVKRKKIN